MIGEKMVILRPKQYRELVFGGANALAHLEAIEKMCKETAQALHKWLEQHNECEPMIADAINRLNHYAKNKAVGRYGKDLGSLDPEFVTRFTLCAGHNSTDAKMAQGEDKLIQSMSKPEPESF